MYYVRVLYIVYQWRGVSFRQSPFPQSLATVFPFDGAVRCYSMDITDISSLRILFYIFSPPLTRSPQCHTTHTLCL